jgi:3-methylcrotonyl-CoA carboxylase beta subunit
LKAAGGQIPKELEDRMEQTRGDYEKWLDAHYAAARGHVDALIDPLATRRILAFAFDAACEQGHRGHVAIETL